MTNDKGQRTALTS